MSGKSDCGGDTKQTSRNVLENSKQSARSHSLLFYSLTNKVTPHKEDQRLELVVI